MASALWELDQIDVRFGDQLILSDFSLRIARGEKVVLRGPSGCGKSSVLRLLLGFIQPDKGVIRFDGQELTPDLAWKLRGQCGYLSQDVDLGPGRAGDWLKSFGGEAASASETVFTQLGLSSQIADKEIKELSGGERQRLAIAGIQLREREILLLDEPTSALDEERKVSVAEHFLSDVESTVVVSSHDPAWNRLEQATIIEMGKE